MFRVWWLPRRMVTGKSFGYALLFAPLILMSVVLAQEPLRAAGGNDVQVQLVERAQGGSKTQQFVVTGLSPTTLGQLAQLSADQPSAWLDTMVVTIASAAATHARPMLGDYQLKNGTLIFVPRFPLRRGSTYRVEVFSTAKPGQRSLTRDFEIAPRPRSRPTRLVAIYPSSKVLPENQLKFYLQFSSPMSRGEAYQRVKLLDQTGRQVDFPFLELGEELWDPTGTRFTLFFDPGRIKRGLKPRELFGPALVEGQSYTLVVDQTWRDAQGNPLSATFKKAFRVVAPDDVQPSINGWQIIEPAVGSHQPLVVSFGEPLDHAMLQRVLTVTQGGAVVSGRIVVSKLESQWSFQPDTKWAPGKHALVVDTALEDLAGNSIGRPFEVDMFDQVERLKAQATIRIPFETLP